MLGRRFSEFEPAEAETGDTNAFSSILEGRDVFGYETVYVSKSGEHRTLLFNARTLRDADGNAIGTQGTAHDITERKRAEKIVRDIAEGISGTVGEAFFADLTGYLAEVLDVEFAFVGEWSPGAPEECTTVAVCAHGQIVPNITYKLAGTPCESVMGQELCTYPRGIQQQFPDDVLLVEWGAESYAGTPLFGSAGQPIGILAVLDGEPCDDIDFTSSVLQLCATRAAAELERRQTDHALAASEEKYRELVQNANCIILRMDHDGNITFFNEFAQSFFGFSEEEIVGRSGVGTIVPETDSSGRDLTAMVAEAIAHPERYATNENENITRTGERVWVAWSNRGIFDEEGQLVEVLCVGSDATARKRAERELQERLRFEELLSDVSARLVSVPAGEVGAEIEDLLRRLAEFLDIERCVVYEADQDGSGFRATHTWTADGAAPITSGVVDDQFPWARERIGQGKVIAFSDPDELPPEAVGLADFYARTGVESGLIIPMVMGGTVIGAIVFSSRHRRQAWPDEVVRRMTLVGEVLANVLTRRRAEREAEEHRRQLARADRMVSLGTLTAGVAHEVNNPNSFIMLNADILLDAWESIVPILDERRRDDPGLVIAGLPYDEMRESVPELISGVREGAERIKRIVEGLKAFARDDPQARKQPVQINAVVESALKLVANRIRKATHRFSADYAAGLPMLPGVSRRLQQVVVNLILNACDALPDVEKGIAISTAFDRDAGCVTITLTDEGVGIPDRQLRRVVDPFFTTKRDSGGTGLGLSVSSGIVRDHGGTMAFDSTPGKGTTVTVRLPVDPSAEAPRRAIA